MITLCKPYPRVSLFRRGSRAVLRRTPYGKPPKPCPRTTPLIIYGDRWQATLDGKPPDLTRREFSVLQALAQGQAAFFSRRSTDSLSPFRRHKVFDRTVDSHIRIIRRKIASVKHLGPDPLLSMAWITRTDG